MPIDHSIYMQQVGINSNPGQAFEGGMRLGDLMQQRKDNAAIKDTFKRNTLKNADGTLGFNRPQLLSDLANINPEKALAYQKEFATNDKAAFEAKKLNTEYDSELFKKKIAEQSEIAKLAGSVTDQTTWEQAIGQAKKLGVDTSHLPSQYDPSIVKNIFMSSLTAKERLEHEAKQRELKAKEQEVSSKVQADAVKTASELRRERSGLPTTKATQDVSAAYNKIQSAMANPSPAGDMSLIFNYMKMLDPGSTVREGEYATAQQATGVPNQILNAYNRALKGEGLNPDQRKDFAGQAGRIYKSQLDVQKQVDSQFGELAKKSGSDPKDVLLNFEANSPKGQPKTVIQNGHTYILNPQTGEYE